MTDDPMDDISKARAAKRLETVDEDEPDDERDVMELDVPVRMSSSSLDQHFLNIGLRAEAATLGLWDPVNAMLQIIAIRLYDSGVDRDAASQILFSTWRGRETIPELDALPPEVAKQTRRVIDWALDETVALCTMRETAPQLAWYAMSIGIDAAERVALPS